MNASRQHNGDRIRNGVPPHHIVAELINNHEVQLQTDDEVIHEHGNARTAKNVAAVMDNAAGTDDEKVSVWNT